MIIFLIYLSSVIDDILTIIRASLIAIVLFYILVGFSMFATYADNKKEPSKLYQMASKYKKHIFTTIAFLLVGGTAVPDKNTYIAMVGVYMGQEVLSNPKSLELFDKAYKAIDVSLDEIINSKKEGK